MADHLHDHDSIDSLLDADAPDLDDEDLWALHREEITCERAEQAEWAEQEKRDVLAAVAAQLVPVLADLVADEACRFDHRGHCQAHDWPRTAPRCPHERGRGLLTQLKASHPQLVT